MAKRKKKNQQSNIFRILLLIVVISLGAVLLYEHFRSPILHAANDVKYKTEATMAPEKKEISGDLERPQLITSRPEQIINHAGYTVSYNPEWRVPNWVSYELTEYEITGKLKRSDKFVVDPEVNGICATNEDYAHSGYDRGHMAPAADMKWNTRVMKECFYFSNMCPQKHSLNAGRWKTLEEKVRDWAQEDSAIIIVCGPIVDKGYKTIGSDRVAVPQRFFKVILAPYLKSPKAIGFIMKNDEEALPLSSYAVSVDNVEKLTGMDFFSALPDEFENRIESSNSTTDWGL
ncbi:DNA/RNA non-specific endonuclease [uncultured Bacteroides sp.]|uniref:DNA/RNA non-specific endonuclease n=1 Tax=uncultured Bacteroides sp. TaxID=162156 RepID=UPI002AAB255E|nr:DNA/RNA non-specific endonuclease [uncultured Bacteroides sp.]